LINICRSDRWPHASIWLLALELGFGLPACGRWGYDSSGISNRDGSVPAVDGATGDFSGGVVADADTPGTSPPDAALGTPDAAPGSYCFGPRFPDPNVDYDGDGIPCGQDPCIFDGPAAQGYPATVEPVGELTVSAADIAGTGRTYASVAPGASFTVEFDYLV
jgi:hypothetical protein